MLQCYRYGGIILKGHNLWHYFYRIHCVVVLYTVPQFTALFTRGTACGIIIFRDTLCDTFIFSGTVYGTIMLRDQMCVALLYSEGTMYRNVWRLISLPFRLRHLCGKPSEASHAWEKLSWWCRPGEKKKGEQLQRYLCVMSLVLVLFHEVSLVLVTTLIPAIYKSLVLVLVLEFFLIEKKCQIWPPHSCMFAI